MKTYLWIAFGVVGSACSSPTNVKSDARPIDAHAIDARPIDGHPAGTVVNGTVGGTGFAALDAVWANVSANGFDFNGMSTDVTVTDFANECAAQTSQTGTPNGKLLVFVLATTDGAGNSSPINAAGTYTVFTGTPAVSSKLAEVYFEVDGADCLKSNSGFATSGTVTVTSATDPMQATFDVTFPSDHIMGSYHATSCTALDPNSTPLC